MKLMETQFSLIVEMLGKILPSYRKPTFTKTKTQKAKNHNFTLNKTLR